MKVLSIIVTVIATLTAGRKVHRPQLPVAWSTNGNNGNNGNKDHPGDLSGSYDRSGSQFDFVTGNSGYEDSQLFANPVDDSVPNYPDNFDDFDGTSDVDDPIAFKPASGTDEANGNNGNTDTVDFELSSATGVVVGLETAAGASVLDNSVFEPDYPPFEEVQQNFEDIDESNEYASATESPFEETIDNRRNPLARSLEMFQLIKFDLPASYNKEKTCKKVTKTEEKIAWSETMVCKETSGEECYNSYVTDFTPVEVEVCNDSFEKHCHIYYKEQSRTINVEVCRNVPERNCTGIENAEDSCDSFVHEIVCETSFHSIKENVPHCEPKMIEHCYDGINGRQCHNTTHTECKLVQQNVTKFSSPDVNCKKIQTDICKSRSCPITFTKTCETHLKQKIVSLPVEKCQIQPTKDCRDETRMVPKISLESKCISVPRTTCEKVRNPMRQNVTTVEYRCQESNDNKAIRSFKGNLLVVGGISGSVQVELIDVDSKNGSFRCKHNIKPFPKLYYYTATVLLGGKVPAVCGGQADKNCYLLKNNTWVAGPNLSQTRRGPMAITLNDTA